MDDETRTAKNKRIKETGKKTRARHANMVCKVFDVKIAYNHLSKAKKDALYATRREYKYTLNDYIAHDCDTNRPLPRVVEVKCGDHYETRHIRTIGTRIQQAAREDIARDKRALAGKKRAQEARGTKGKKEKIGALKFKKECDTVRLPQYGNTHKYSPDYKRIRIQNIGWLKINGGKQLEGWELADARLVFRADGIHVLQTAFMDKEAYHDLIGHKHDYVPGTAIGIDMGFEHQFFFSDGSSFEEWFDDSERHRELSRKLSRQKKGSKSYRDTRRKIRKENLKRQYRADNAANQLVRALLWNEYVAFQDEMIQQWAMKKKQKDGTRHRGSGRKVQHGILGRVKARLRHHAEDSDDGAGRVFMLPRSYATTATCPICGCMTKHRPNRRTYVCSGCGFTFPRDWHSAILMLLFAYHDGLFSPGMDGTFVPVEGLEDTSGRMAFFTGLSAWGGVLPLLEGSFSLGVSLGVSNQAAPVTSGGTEVVTAGLSGGVEVATDSQQGYSCQQWQDAPTSKATKSL